jgi:hypothetical protein
VAPLKAALSKVLSYSHWIILILLTFGETIFPKLGIVPPAIYYTLKEKQWMVIIGSYFICNQLSASLVNTGAFEVYDDNKLIFSKLKSGNVPSTQDILALLFKS